MVSPEQFTEGVTAFNGLKDSVGLALAVSFVFNMMMLILYWGERRDRRMAWSAHNRMLKENIQVLGTINTSVAVLISMQKPAARRRATLPEKTTDAPSQEANDE